MKAKLFLEAAGLAALYALPIANAFLDSWHMDSFHHAQPVASIPRAILVLTLLVWALAWLILVALDRLPPRGRAIAGIALPTLLIWLLGRIAAGVSVGHPTVVPRILMAAHIGVTIVPLILLVLWWLRPRTLQQILDGTRILFVVAAFGMLILLPKLAWHGLRFEAREQTSFIHPSLPSASSTQPRIVWILMDELSYDQVFEHRPSGLSFPHFEQFAQHSTTFSSLLPTGYQTEEIIPGLIYGQPVADVEHIYGKPFRFRSVNRGPWHPYDPSQTIFGEARQLGWTTGLAGWYNPYCRFLRSVLDHCSWRFSDEYRALPAPVYYTWSTLRNLLSLLPPHERMPPSTDESGDNQAHLRDYREVMAQSESLLRDLRIRLVMLHLPVPHTPGIYDRRRHALGPAGNYIDNLVLADNTLGQLMTIIQSTPSASETSVIVSSDHSWRVEYWKKQPDWTQEERQVSGERFDPRPVLMVNLPGSDNGQVISQPVSAMIVHPILESLLRGRLRSSGDIAALVDGQPARQQKDK